MKCTRCKCAFYCSQACQKKNWKEHKTVCNALANEFVRWQIKETTMNGYLDSSAKGASDECAVCMEAIQDSSLALPCNHVFCQSCMMEHQQYMGANVACPLCRSQVPGGLFQYIYANACYFVNMGRRKPSLKEHYCGLARKELRAFETKELSSPEIRTLTAELLYLEEKYEESIELSLKIINSPIEPSEAIHRTVLRNIIRCYVDQRRHHDAMKYIKDLFKIADDPVKYAEDVRFLFHMASECMYELGSYQESINFGHASIEANRHYEGVHRCVALSQQALGQLDEAVRTMRMAVRYEAPWNPAHTARNQTLLDELLAQQVLGTSVPDAVLPVGDEVVAGEVA